MNSLQERERERERERGRGSGASQNCERGQSENESFIVIDTYIAFVMSCLFESSTNDVHV